MRFVERAVHQHLKAVLPTRALKSLALEHPVTFDKAKHAALCGLPMNVVKVWASDAAFSLSAQRRMLTNVEDINDSRKAEMELRQGSMEAEAPLGSADYSRDRDELAKAIDAMKVGALPMSDDAMTVPTIIAPKPRPTSTFFDGELPGSGTHTPTHSSDLDPDDSASMAGLPAMKVEDEKALRAELTAPLAAAHQMKTITDSVLAGMVEDEPAF
jgi:hypothetical protein